MKKVVAFVGSARNRLTHGAVRLFLERLQEQGAVDWEIVGLGECNLGTCRGCKLCFEKGEEFCPLKDDRDALIAKMEAADGVVFATPNYMFQVSALMKIFIDRLGFCGHRPRFFGKTFTSIVGQGIFGGGKIVKYLDFVGACLGFNVVRGSCVTACEPMTEGEARGIETTIARHARRFHKGLQRPAFPVPSLLMLMGFRLGRTKMKIELDMHNRDFRHYAEKGWFESDYFYSVRLGLVRKLVGSLFDRVAARASRNRQADACVAAQGFRGRHI